MKLSNLLIVLPLSLLALTSCQSSTCKDPDIFDFRAADTCYQLSVGTKVDSVVVLPSHTTPENLVTSIGLSYQFDNFSDPYQLMIFVAEGAVINTRFLDCSYYLYDDALQTDGIVVLDTDDCYSLINKDYYIFVTPAQ